METKDAYVIFSTICVLFVLFYGVYIFYFNNTNRHDGGFGLIFFIIIIMTMIAVFQTGYDLYFNKINDENN